MCHHYRCKLGSTRPIFFGVIIINLIFFPTIVFFSETDYERKKDDQKRSLLNERKADDSSEATKSHDFLDYNAKDSLPGTVCSFLKLHQYLHV